MTRSLRNVIYLTLKELRSFLADPILLVLVVYIFSFAIYSIATGAKVEVSNAAVAVVDEDHSALSRQIYRSLLPPLFKEAALVSPGEASRGMDRNRYVFLIEIPSNFEKDLFAGHKPTIALSVDATAMSLAGSGVVYIQNILSEEIGKAVTRSEGETQLTVKFVLRRLFNPNSDSTWFTSVMEIVNHVTMLGILLAGAALIREREHGTIEHLLVMPVTPVEIMLAKILANGFVILVAAVTSLVFMVHEILGVPIGGSVLLFALGTSIYLVAVTGLGLMLATWASSMPQFALLSMPVLIVLMLLSGSSTPIESMPTWLRLVMQLTPSTHFVAFSQDVLYRGAGFEIVWPQLLTLAIIGALYFSLSLARFRHAITGSQ